MHSISNLDTYYTLLILLWSDSLPSVVSLYGCPPGSIRVSLPGNWAAHVPGPLLLSLPASLHPLYRHLLCLELCFRTELFRTGRVERGDKEEPVLTF